VGELFSPCLVPRRDATPYGPHSCAHDLRLSLPLALFQVRLNYSSPRHRHRLRHRRHASPPPPLAADHLSTDALAAEPPNPPPYAAARRVCGPGVCVAGEQMLGPAIGGMLMRVTRSDMGRVSGSPRVRSRPGSRDPTRLPTRTGFVQHPSLAAPRRPSLGTPPKYSTQTYVYVRIRRSLCASAATRARSSRAVSLPPRRFPRCQVPLHAPAAGRLHAPLLPSLGPAACPAAAPSLASPPRLASGCRPQAGCHGTACMRPSPASVVTWPPRRSAPAPPPWPPPPSPWWRPRPPCQPPRRRTRPRSRPPRPPPPRSSFMARARPGARRRASAGCPRRWSSSPPSPTWWRGGSACRPPCSRRRCAAGRSSSG